MSELFDFEDDWDAASFGPAARFGRKRALDLAERAVSGLNRTGPQRPLSVLPAEALALVAAIADCDEGFRAALDERPREAIDRLSGQLAFWEEAARP